MEDNAAEVDVFPPVVLLLLLLLPLWVLPDPNPPTLKYSLYFCSFNLYSFFQIPNPHRLIAILNNASLNSIEVPPTTCTREVDDFLRNNSNKSDDVRNRLYDNCTCCCADCISD